MKAKLSPREAFALYGVVMIFLTAFYVGGLFLGKEYFVQAEVAAEEVDLPEISEERQPGPELGFYEELSDPPDEMAQFPATNPVAGSVEAVKPEPEQPLETAGETASGGGEVVATASAAIKVGALTVQVGAFSTQAEADQLLLRLQAYDFEGLIKPPNPTAGDRFYHVWVGQFADRASARPVEDDLKSKGFSTYIKRMD